MKNRINILLVIFCAVITTSCEHNFIDLSNTYIKGEMAIADCPFNDLDSVLCLKRIKIICVETNSADSSQYIRLLTSVGNTTINFHFGTCQIDCLPYKEELFYITNNRQLISVMNQNKTKKEDYVCFEYTGALGGKVKETIYTYSHNDSDKCTDGVYIGDTCRFNGNNNSPRPFLYDTIAPNGDLIHCVEINTYKYK